MLEHGQCNTQCPVINTDSSARWKPINSGHGDSRPWLQHCCCDNLRIVELDWSRVSDEELREMGENTDLVLASGRYINYGTLKCLCIFILTTCNPDTCI